MCGIAGLWNIKNSFPEEQVKDILLKMTDAIGHRGPDSGGLWHDTQSHLSLGHRRLAIQDVSQRGNQPMPSSCKRFVIVFNGEIYNALLLKTALEGAGHVFEGHSDTEILVEFFAKHGIKETLAKIKGMFAIALWDRRERALQLMTDHIGKKPLYVGQLGGSIVFTSELKSILTVPALKQHLALDHTALEQYTRYGFIPAPYSIASNVRKLKPGHIMTLSADSAADINLTDQMTPYWDMEKSCTQSRNTNAALSIEEQQEQLAYYLETAVKERLISDVPVGAFLSGGIDSSLIVALTQQQMSTPLKTLCVGFEDGAFDESPHAAAIAKHLGTDHTTLTITPKETRDIIPNLPYMYDEPFADYSAIPTYHVCKAAKTMCTVALSGDGGDEGFCGYSRYFMTRQLHQKLKKIPHSIRSLSSRALLFLPESTLNPIAAIIGRVVNMPMSGKRLHSIARFMDFKSLDELIINVMSITQSPSAYLLNPGEQQTASIMPSAPSSPLEKMMLFDTGHYLTGDILTKVDRASMMNSLEVRAPLLDKDLLQFAWSLPLERKIFAGSTRGKKPLYDLLSTHVPQTLIDRPKQGFSVPMASWLRGPLREWAEDLLSPNALAKANMYKIMPVRKLWADFQNNKHDTHHTIWTILMAQAWHKHWFQA